MRTDEACEQIMKQDADYWIHKLGLAEHPEGGYFRETYRSSESVGADTLAERFGGKRNLCTAIYFLLRGDQISDLHRLKSDELWHFYFGSPLTVHVIGEAGQYQAILLGPNAHAGEVFQASVSCGCWFGATVDIPRTYALVGCTVSPGFNFQDFELGNRANLMQKYPEHARIIKKLTSEES